MKSTIAAALAVVGLALAGCQYTERSESGEAPGVGGSGATEVGRGEPIDPLRWSASPESGPVQYPEDSRDPSAPEVEANTPHPESDMIHE